MFYSKLGIVHSKWFESRAGVQYGAQFPATKDGNMYFVPQKASNQLKLTLNVASVFKKQV